ncbi:MAG: hypothetical protein IPF99_21585 [Deltaproteobacteria bacterium]|nr:hypothetical protein [Deltaproteobacteria bacterium]
MSTSRTRRKPARSSSATKESPTKPAASDGSGDVRGELRQLAEIRGRFPALDADTAAALHAHHDDDACRAKGTVTRAADTFRGAMSWAYLRRPRCQPCARAAAHPVVPRLRDRPGRGAHGSTRRRPHPGQRL